MSISLQYTHNFSTRYFSSSLACLLGASPPHLPHRQQRGSSGKAQEHRLGRERGGYMQSAWAGIMVVSKGVLKQWLMPEVSSGREGRLATVV